MDLTIGTVESTDTLAFDIKYLYRGAPANDTSIGFAIADAQLAILVSVSVSLRPR